VTQRRTALGWRQQRLVLRVCGRKYVYSVLIVIVYSFIAENISLTIMESEDVVCGTARSVRRTRWRRWKEMEWIHSVVGGHVASTLLIHVQMGN